MRRFLIVFMITGLVAGSVATSEAKKAERKRVERTVEGSYGPYPAPVTGCNSALGTFACFIVKSRATEAFFTAKVTDTHDQPVFVEVKVNGGPRVARFCGETKEPIPFEPGVELAFFVALPLWPEVQMECPVHSIKTTGTISVTLSNLP